MRNLGPTFSFPLIQWSDRNLPRWLVLFLIWFFTWCAVFILRRQRAASREYLSTLFGRPATLSMVARHFRKLGEMLLIRMRVVNGHSPRIIPEFTDREAFLRFIESDTPALFGTFHVGHSDLLGFYLADRKRRVGMIRLRVGNSVDMERLTAIYGDSINLIWINEPDEMLFTLKEQAAAGNSLAMQCDRVEYASKAEAFHFLGKKRLFPFTIYHLAWIFQMPVIFCIGEQEGIDATAIKVWPAFEADRSQGRAAFLKNARLHFQTILSDLEEILKKNPWIWFNFIPLNPAVEEEQA